MIIGVTGSSGAGKTTVCEILEKEYKFRIIVADKIAKDLSKNNISYNNEIIDLFGKEIVLDNGELNRKKLANIIYNDNDKRKKLNNCTFKYIVKEIKQQISENNNYNIAIDAPLLFEADLHKICDKTIAIISNSFEEQVDRIIKRDNITKEEAISRIKAQQTNDFYIRNCHYKIINNSELREQIDTVIKEITNKSK